MIAPSPEADPVETTNDIRIPCPAGWSRQRPEGTDLVLLAPPAGTGAFRPSVVVTSQPYDGSIAKLSTFAMAAAIGELDRAHLIACNIWPHPAGSGRQIEYSHQLGNQVLHVQRWTFAVDGRAVDVTATCASTQLTAFDELFGYLAAKIEFRRAG
ncbi:hypothetical protein [Arthrobacter sp. Marseille-P9274]|uniref:hypothetical protein n=1 Tax=Arthrobacter sp. Marseille-P9274 TaxID=2866572 RepID=UPI0021C6D83C|nr:hypothetical protein [Arthrobacter sp. Marseille-P9274]